MGKVVKVRYLAVQSELSLFRRGMKLLLLIPLQLKLKFILICYEFSWFTHFYVFGVFYTFLVLITMMWKIVLKNQLSTLVTSYISFVSPYTHNPLGNWTILTKFYSFCIVKILSTYKASPELSLLAAVLFFLQTSRRLYECLCVTVFADSKMNLGHYLVGYLHYWGCATVILSYSADYSRTNGRRFQRNIFPLHDNLFFNLLLNNLDFVRIPSSDDIPLQPIFGIILFTLAYYHQYTAHVSLANLRKGKEFFWFKLIIQWKFHLFLDPKNKQKHSLPKNGLFNYVSCPNFLCEIIIYVSLYIILGFNHYPWALITFWVLTNQVCLIKFSQKLLLNHVNLVNFYLFILADHDCYHDP